MASPNKIIFVLMLLAFFTPGRDADAGGIDIADQFPIEDTTTLIYVRDQYDQAVEGAKVAVTYRPGSKVEKNVSLGLTDAGGKVKWNPEDAGIVEITAKWTEKGSESVLTRNVSVKFASAPIAGIMIMIFAGLLLLGGSIIRFARLLRTPNQSGAS